MDAELLMSFRVATKNLAAATSNVADAQEKLDRARRVEFTARSAREKAREALLEMLEKEETK